MRKNYRCMLNFLRSGDGNIMKLCIGQHMYSLQWDSFFCCTFLVVTVIVWYIMLTFSFEYKELGLQMKNCGTNGTKNKHFNGYSQSGRYGTSYGRDLIRLIKAHRKIYEYDFNFTSNASRFSIVFQ